MTGTMTKSLRHMLLTRGADICSFLGKGATISRVVNVPTPASGALFCRFASTYAAKGLQGRLRTLHGAPRARGAVPRRYVAHGTARPTYGVIKPRQVVKIDEPFITTMNQRIAGVQVVVECHGDPALPASRTVVILPSFSHSAHCASNLADPSPGWWQDIVGPGKAIDTVHFRVLCISLLGSPFSPCNPASINPDTGKAWRATFPQLTPTDLARCHALVLAKLGLPLPPHGPPLHALIGSSLGGMQALQLASLVPEAAKRLIAIATTGRTTPFTVAIRRSQRRAILADPQYYGGDYGDRGPGIGPWEGLALAREIGTMFYRSRDEFDERFAWGPAPGAGPAVRHFTSTSGTWEVESYLSYAGTKFARTYDPNAYLLLSKAMDLQDLGDGAGEGRGSYSEAAARIGSAGTRCLLVPVAQDALIPAGELATLASAINSGAEEVDARAVSLQPPQDSGTGPWNWSAAPARLVVMSSAYGHDAFLKEPAWLGERIRGHLEEGLVEQLRAEAVHSTGENAP